MNASEARPKAEHHTERVPLTCGREWLQKVDDWRFARRLGSRAEAIRALVTKGLEAETTKTGEAA